MKRAADAQLESNREKYKKDGLLNQLETYQNERADAISQGDSLKKAEFSALVADVKLEIASRALEDPPNDEAKTRALNAQRELRGDQRQEESNRRRAIHDLKVAELERKVAEAEADANNPALGKMFREAHLKWDEAAERADIATMFRDHTKAIPTNMTLAELDAVAARYPLEPRFGVYDPEAQATLLRDFNDPDHPWVVTGQGRERRIEMILQPSLLDGDRPLAKTLERYFQSENRHHFVVGVSGAGKTSAITDLAKRHFVVYFQCEGESMRDRNFSRFTDDGYARMINVFHVRREEDVARRPQGSYPHTSSSSSFKKQEETDRFNRAIDLAKVASKIELVSRLAQLRRLLELKPELTPFDYLLHQHILGDVWLAKVRKELAGLSDSCCQDLVLEMCEGLEGHLRQAERSASGCKLVVVVDELEVGMSVDGVLFAPEQEQRGFAVWQARAYHELTRMSGIHVIYMGTGTSYDRRGKLHSAINKEPGRNVLETGDNFPVVTPESCQRLLSRLDLGDGAGRLLMGLESIQAVPWSEREMDALIHAMEFARVQASNDLSLAVAVMNRMIIGSRFRTLTQIIPNLIDFGIKHPEWPKLARFNAAVCSAVLGARDDLEETFKKAAESYKETDDFRKFNRYLLSIWTGVTLMQGKVRFLHTTAPQDLTRLGLGNYVGVVEAKDQDLAGYYHISEPIVLLGLRYYFQLNQTAVDRHNLEAIISAMSALVESHGLTSSRGTLLEDMIFHSIRHRRFQNRAVVNLPFVQEAVKRAEEERRARQAAELRQKSTARATSTVVARFEQEAKEAKDWLESQWFATTPFTVSSYVRYDAAREGGQPLDTATFLQANPHVLYAPETTARFDGMVMLGGDKAMTFGITMWAEEVPGEKVRSQVKSTDQRLAFYTVDGFPNDQCASQREAWERARLHHLKAVRVHVALPKFATKALDGIGVNKDDFLVHLDCSNIGALMPLERKGVRELLAAATRTEVDDWIVFCEEDQVEEAEGAGLANV